MKEQGLEGRIWGYRQKSQMTGIRGYRTVNSGPSKACPLSLIFNPEQWFADNCLMIAKRCLSLIYSDPVGAAYAIEGFASAHGGSKVAWSTHMFASGDDVNFVSRERGAYDERDTTAVAKLFPHFHEKNPGLASFMLDYPGCTFVPGDPKQGNLL